MFFCYDETGRVMICAEENVFPDMEEAMTPEGFLPEEQADWRKVGERLVHDPLPREEAALTDRQRIEVLEEKNRELKEALELLLSGEVKEDETDG